MMASREIFHRGMTFGHGYMTSGWSWLIGLGVVLIIVAATYLIVRKNKQQATGSNALESLKMKFVQGEITQEEYETRKNVLEGK